jgi:hypothetical protein
LLTEFGKPYTSIKPCEDARELVGLVIFLAIDHLTTLAGGRFLLGSLCELDRD